MSSTLTKQQLPPSVCLHRMRSGKTLSVAHPRFGRAQNPIHNHCGYVREME